MHYSMYPLLLLATTIPNQPQPSDEPEYTPSDEPGQAPTSIEDVIAEPLRAILEHRRNFRTNTINPQTAHLYEIKLDEQLRELGRIITQSDYNAIESANVDQVPKHVVFQNNVYTRLNHKTPQNAWTLFGQIRLERVGYRPTDKTAEPTLFPLPMALGLVQGASPALAEQAATYLAEAGMSQERTLQRLERDHNVGWGVKKLREVGAAMAAQTSPHRHEAQVEQLLKWLQQADESQGRHKPLLCVGRDGISLGVRCKGGSVKEMASTATVSVLDRRGERLGTVYLAQTPESCQKTMSENLTKLLEETLRRWEGGSLRLGYVTDSGDNETNYYEKTLEGMIHPRTEEPLEWIRVADYYHLSERIWTMAETLFGCGQRGTSWAKKMLRWLLKPSGVYRVLHSAAALRSQSQLGKEALAEFEKAYSYIRDRIPYAQYADYRRVGLPCGSGVTEAACKTVFTQRLKLSGMRWKKEGAQVILDLRVLLLSGVWDATYQRVLRDREQPKVWTQSGSAKHPETNGL